MSNLPVVLSNEASLAQLPAEMFEGFRELQSAAFADMSSGGRSFLRVRTTSFLLTDGGDGEAIPFNTLYAVVLGVNKRNHAIWYNKKYDPASGNDSPPDLVWYFDGNGPFPDALPPHLREKIDIQGVKRWDFAIRRRTVWALVRSDAQTHQSYIDFENPFVFDIPASSLYGDSNTADNQYRWAGLAGLCNRLSRNGVVVYPGMFPIQIVPDAGAKAMRGVVLFKPVMDMNTGGIQFLSNDLIAEVFRQATSETVKQLCEVQEKLTWEAAQQPAPATAAPQPAPAPAAPAAPAAPQCSPIPGPAPTTKTRAKSAAPKPAAQPQPQGSPLMSVDAMGLLAEATKVLSSEPQEAATPQDNIMAMMGALSK